MKAQATGEIVRKATPIQNKYHIHLFFDATGCNPNGDPDMGNLPRTMHDGSNRGIITDVCIKRKLRNTVTDAVEEGLLPAEGNDMYVQKGVTLDARDLESCKAVGIADDSDTPDKTTNLKAKLKKIAGTEQDILLHDEMCRRYFDIRAFGGVMTLSAGTQFSKNACGPVQFSPILSVDPVFPETLTVYRCVVTKEDKASAGSTFGAKSIVPYGLYHCVIEISPKRARETGFSEEDVKTLLFAIKWMFNNDMSAARSGMALRKVILFKHQSSWGDVGMETIQDAVEVKHRDGVKVPGKFSDYELIIHKELLPESIEVTELV